MTVVYAICLIIFACRGDILGKLESLTNNNYRVLSYLYDNRDNKNLVKTTQMELSQELGFHRTTVNSIIKNLSENGYIYHDESKVGHYYLTEYGVKTVKLFRKLEK